jgi:hypothetical protein
MKIFQSLTLRLGGSFALRFDEFGSQVLARGLTDSDAHVQLSALVALGDLINYLEPEQAPTLVALFPTMFAVVESLLNAGLEDESCDALEAFIQLVESPLNVLEGELLGTLIAFMLKISASPLPKSIRQSAMSIVEFAVMCQPKRAVRMDLVEPIVDGLFLMLSEPPSNDDLAEMAADRAQRHATAASSHHDDDDSVPTEEDEIAGDGSSSLSSYKCACHILQGMATELPRSAILPAVAARVSAHMSGSVRQRRAALGALAMVSCVCGIA